MSLRQNGKTLTQRLQARGPGSRKLTEDQVRDIKRRLSTGESAAEISRVYGRGKTTIGDIASGRNWSWVQVP